MANISKIKLPNGTTYNITDTTSGYLTTHQDISGKADKSATVSTITYDSTNKKLTKTINGTTSDVVTVATLKTALGSMPASDVYSWAKASSKPSYSYSEISGTIPSSALPSYVDDVLEYSAKSGFPTTGETGKIYVDTSTNLTWRWSGSTYVEISPSLALGTTSSTAYRGDYGNTAYTHATDANRLTTAKTSGLYKIAVTAHGHVQSVTAVAKADITGLGIPAQDTTYSSKAAASGGTDVSLVTTGEKYIWNNKIGATTPTIATDTGTSSITLAHGGKYKLTAGGGSVIFTMPADANTWRGIQDNLTSSTNTTESLSAKQGYLLANGSARDSTKLPLTGGNVTGPVNFGDSVSIDDLTAGQLVVSGSASVANNLQVNTINGVTVGSSPKFTDTNTVTTATTTGSGNAVTAVSASNGALTITKGTTFLTSHQAVTNKGATLSWGSAVTVATIGSTNINVSLPANPNTHYTTHLYAGSGTAANATTTNGNTKITVTDDSTVRNSITIKGAGGTTVTSDASGNITITSTAVWA